MLLSSRLYSHSHVEWCKNRDRYERMRMAVGILLCVRMELLGPETSIRINVMEKMLPLCVCLHVWNGTQCQTSHSIRNKSQPEQRTNKKNGIPNETKRNDTIKEEIQFNSTISYSKSKSKDKCISFIVFVVVVVRKFVFFSSFFL